MSPKRRFGANREIGFVQRLQVVVLFAAAYNNHRIIMTRKNIVYHQSCDASVPVFKRMDANISIMENGGKFYWRELAGTLCVVIPIYKV